MQYDILPITMRSTTLQGFLLLSLATLGAVGQSTSLSIHRPSGGPHTSSGSGSSVSTLPTGSSRSSTSEVPTVSNSATSSGTPTAPTSTAPPSTAPTSASTSANPTTSAPSRALSVKASIGGVLGMVAIPLIFQL